MKRIVWVLMLIVLVLLTAAGCTQPTPPATPTPTATPTPEPMKNIVEIAAADGRFTTLVAAVQAAGLVDTLSGPGPFTVFAPTDDAFSKLPPGTVDTLLMDPQGDLTQILLYHVVPGKYMAADVVKETSLMTAEGSPLTVSVNGSTVMVDGATIVIADIEADNGVIHVIDAVMLPP